MVQFRCPHNGPLADFDSRGDKIAARKEKLDVPEDVEWEIAYPDRGPDDPVAHKATFLCPVCGAQITVVTDQDVT